MDPPLSFDDLLSISGKSCRIHRDDDLALRLDSGAHLLDYFEITLGSKHESRCRSKRRRTDNDGAGTAGSSSSAEVLLMDRYDCRTLLDQYEDFYKRKDRKRATVAMSDEADEEEKVTNFERFGALPEYALLFLGKQENAEEVDDNKSKNQVEQEEEEAFEISERVPDGMEVPKTARLYNIMKMTAARAAVGGASGAQFEVLLKVKQRDSENFSFLDRNDVLHPLYSLMKEGHIKEKGQDCEGGTFTKENGSAGLSALASYASSSDEEEKEEMENDGRGKASDSLFAAYSSENDDAPEVEAKEKDRNKCSVGNNVSKDNPVGDVVSAETNSSYSSAPAVAQAPLEKSEAKSKEELKAIRLRRALKMREHFGSKMG
uniref:SURP motif domain-containing protein n=2 Tax=Corethron hystrix TaxID=216773 RepID=A0A7S1C042_9STRA